jgi:hypothetical protein
MFVHLAETLRAIYNDLEQIRIFVITDRIANSKSFKTKEINGKAVRLEVMDIETATPPHSGGETALTSLVIDFNELSRPAPALCLRQWTRTMTMPGRINRRSRGCSAPALREIWGPTS